MKKGKLLPVIIVVTAIAIVVFDRMSVAKYNKTFMEIEKQRIVTSNKLATAKIVYENLNHVRDLIFDNMDFPGQTKPSAHETKFFRFLTQCINDLKLKLVSVKPIPPKTTGRVSTYSYELKLEGDFFKFGELCSKFENSRRIITVENFKVGLAKSMDKNKKELKMQKGKEIEVFMRVNTYRIKKG